jgi:hypothetical protein
MNRPRTNTTKIRIFGKKQEEIRNLHRKEENQHIVATDPGPPSPDPVVD